jgi:hypothetical protein
MIVPDGGRGGSCVMTAPRGTAGAVARRVDFDFALGAGFEVAFAADVVGVVSADEPAPEPVAVRGAGGIVTRLLARVYEHTFCR